MTSTNRCSYPEAHDDWPELREFLGDNFIVRSQLDGCASQTDSAERINHKINHLQIENDLVTAPAAEMSLN